MSKELIRIMRELAWEASDDLGIPADQTYPHKAVTLIEAKDASIEHYKSGLESAIGDITKLKALCDQLGNALDGLTVAMDLRLDDDDLSSDSRMAFEALAAWRNSK